MKTIKVTEPLSLIFYVAKRNTNEKKSVALIYQTPWPASVGVAHRFVLKFFIFYFLIIFYDLVFVADGFVW